MMKIKNIANFVYTETTNNFLELINFLDNRIKEEKTFLIISSKNPPANTTKQELKEHKQDARSKIDAFEEIKAYLVNELELEL